MERKRAYNFYVLKDQDLQSPDSKKDVSLDEGGIVQAEPTGIRRNLAKVFEGDDDSSGDDSIVEILSEDEARAEEYYDEAERLPIYKKSICWIIVLRTGPNYRRPRIPPEKCLQSEASRCPP